MIVILDPIRDEGGDFRRETEAYLSRHYPGDRFRIVTLEDGPEEIGNFTQKTLACASILRHLDEFGDASAVVVNCFADPCLFELRENLNVPVFGAGETTLHIAAMLGEFSVVGPGQNLASWTRIQAREYGLLDKLVSVRGIALPLGGILKNEEGLYGEALSACEKAVEDGADVVVLGCTGFVNIADRLMEEVWERFGVPVLEPLLTTYGTARSLYPFIRHGKRGLFSGK
ncbi:aspartate/glutamate racemase family protein [Thermococcus sp. 5-4]|uniref:aspartate/glutamate racemase family protein n=1 Tax=Thermococcus sp. 5-4 TaxID=2008440 RepID=UPI000B49CB8F|nr:aspartate/glutamate racemase family protein [Thermococcus sp. 5-4]ASA78104.1 Asp/Glu racemase [Thermococcus sp. 5-4]